MILSLVGQEPVRGRPPSGGYYLHNAIADVTTTHLAFPGGERAHVFVSWLHPFKEQKLVVDRRPARWRCSTTASPGRRSCCSIRTASNGARRCRCRSAPTPSRSRSSGRAAASSNASISSTASPPARRPRTDGGEGLRVLRVLTAASAALKRPRGGRRTSRVASGAAPGFGRRRADPSDRPVVDDALRDRRRHAGSGISATSCRARRIGRELRRSGRTSSSARDVAIGDNCKIQNNVSVYKGVTLEDGVFCGPSCVFTNVNNPRAEDRAQGRVPPDPGQARRHDRRQRDDRLRPHARRICVHRRRRGGDAGRAGLRADGRRAGAAHRLDEPCRRDGSDPTSCARAAAGAIARPVPTASRRSLMPDAATRRRSHGADRVHRSRRAAPPHRRARWTRRSCGWSITAGTSWARRSPSSSGSSPRSAAPSTCISCANGTDALVLALMAKGVRPGRGGAGAVLHLRRDRRGGGLVRRDAGLRRRAGRHASTWTRRASRRRSPRRGGSGSTPTGGRSRSICSASRPITTRSCAIAAAHGLWVSVRRGAELRRQLSRAARSARSATSTTTSFFPAKPLGCYGDGGAVFTDDDEIDRGAAQPARARPGQRQVRQCADRHERPARHDAGGGAARKARDIRRRDRGARPASPRATASCSATSCSVPRGRPTARPSVWAQYTMRLPAGVDRDAVAARLKAAGVPTAVYYSEAAAPPDRLSRLSASPATACRSPSGSPARC